jgi:hypothetical protein
MVWVILKGTKFKHSLGKSELSVAVAAIETARAATGLLLQNIALEIQQHVPGLPAIQIFLNSADAKLCCALEAARKLPECNRPKLETILAIPNLLNLNKPLKEKCQLRVRKKKKKDQFRFIFDFRMAHRAAQQMVLRAMQKLFVPRSFQQARLQEAIGLAKACLLQGKLYFATLDIKDHNGSFSTKMLVAQLPVPPEWVNYVVGGRHTVVDEKEIDVPFVVTVSHHALLLQARRGLPCGSICSPIIAAYSISHLQWETAEGCLLLNYADNFLLLASTSSMLEEKIEELAKAVGKLPGGKFKIRLEQKGHAADGLYFLGHNITAVSEVDVRVSPSSYTSIYKLATAAAQGIAVALSCGNVKKAREHCAPVKGWFASFSACDNMTEFEESIIVGIAQNALLPVEAVKDLMQAAQGQYKFLNDDYQSGT